MKKDKVRTFRSRLSEDVKDPEFKTHYREERQALILAMKIAKLRERKGLSQQQLAKLMGTSQQAISRIESSVSVERGATENAESYFSSEKTFSSKF